MKKLKQNNPKSCMAVAKDIALVSSVVTPLKFRHVPNGVIGDATAPALQTNTPAHSVIGHHSRSRTSHSMLLFLHARMGLRTAAMLELAPDLDARLLRVDCGDGRKSRQVFSALSRDGMPPENPTFAWSTLQPQ